MMQNKANKYLLLVSLLCTCNAYAQTFRYMAELNSVTRPGFYKVDVTPAMSSFVKTDFRDLRIKDEKDNAVPFLISGTLATKQSEGLSPLKILEYKSIDSGKSALIIENSANEKLASMVFKIKNAEVSRTFNLSGSNDSKSWFSILENVSLRTYHNPDEDYFTESIGFPTSTYRFLKVTLYNGNNDPLNIVSVSHPIHDPASQVQYVIENPTLNFARKDTGRVTVLNLINDKHYHINEVTLRINGPKFFRRAVDISAGGRILGNFFIKSDSAFKFNLPVFNDSIIKVTIYNEDNPPLEIAGISTAQERESIISYLEPGKKYRMEFSSPDATAPRFDLINFKDSIPANPGEIKISAITPIGQKAPNTGTGMLRSTWIWVLLTFVLIVLGLLAFRLTNDLARKA